MDKQQPSPSNPLGNSFRCNTSSNGPNFITYLTTTFNASKLLTYNFAYPGAQVEQVATDPSLWNDTRYPNDMTAQVTNGFGDHFPPRVTNERTVDWTGEKSLWIVFFGINDVLAMLDSRQDPDLAIEKILAAYADNLAFAFDNGARNFLLLNTPPMDIMPRFTGRDGFGGRDKPKAPRVKTLVAKFNAIFPRLVERMNERTDGAAKVMVYDFHALVMEMQTGLPAANALLRQYNSHEVSHLEDSCRWYSQEDGSSYWYNDDYYDERCGTGTGGYFWLNNLHPTWSVHKVLAGRIAEMLWGA